MKKLTIIKETIPLIEDLCSGYNMAIGVNAREGYMEALKCVMEMMHNLDILVELYRTEEGDYITRFIIKTHVCGKPWEKSTPCNIFSNDQYLCSLHEHKKPITQLRTSYRRSLNNV